MEPVLLVDNLSVAFPYRKTWLEAVRGVSFQLLPGETMALVGESGSGKSVTSSAVMGLIDPPARVQADRLLFEGKPLLRQSETEWRKLRGHKLSMIFQDPLTALNPVLKIGEQVMEPLQIHEGKDPTSARLEALAWLSRVGLNQPDRVFDSYPHQLSGGMRQRVVIAMALCCRPSVVIADEPTTALDVTVQAQILRLLRSLQDEVGMAVLLITHDLGVVEEVAHRVAVCYNGQVVETATCEELFSNPRHPYTRGLLDSIPRLDRPIGKLPSIPGTPPSLHEPLPGCPFQPRCGQRLDRCASQPAPMLEGVRCWLIEKEAALESAGG
ncbi:MAG: ABC transporter ATP-binding protein [Candidatus Eremiobacteraeota bacterium]|nr:ABC transporter ATP-binding protein [Candidatus Eremiobacteraeota bacterium]MCW5870148.1 ABC transporter ATP-binding protein [Candidatus Eremiobacteraeota bacterium]